MWIRPMLVSDIEEICKLERDIFGDPWSEKSIKDSILSEYDYCMLLEDNYEIFAYIIFRVSNDEGELFRIATDTKKRKSGFAHKLMEFMIKSMENMKVKRLYLEVRSKNEEAIRLYDFFGFKKIGTRKEYYSNPTDDALLMENHIKK